MNTDGQLISRCEINRNLQWTPDDQTSPRKKLLSTRRSEHQVQLLSAGSTLCTMDNDLTNSKATGGRHASVVELKTAYTSICTKLLRKYM